MLEQSSCSLPFGYRVIFSARRRTIRLTVSSGQVEVRAPKGTSKAYLEKVLKQKQDWIQQHLAKSVADAALDRLHCKRILIAGEWRDFSWVLTAKSAVEVTDNAFNVMISHRVSEARRVLYLQQQVQKYFTELATVYFQNEVLLQARRMSLAPTSISIGNWRRRWGYCTSQGKVGFNWRLLQAPSWVARYVVIHELAHLRYLNHSNDFWQLVVAFCPEYKAAKSWLKEHQAQMW